VDSTDGQGADDGRAAPGELITIAEIRLWLGVAKTRAYHFSRYRDFPAPWWTSVDGRVRVWRRRDVEPWLDRNRPGWRAERDNTDIS